jgi:putative ABC transport system substrate-binding protein
MRVTVASVLTAAAFCITADAAVAQDSTKVPRVGVLASTSGPGGLDDGLFQGLRDLGYIDGRNIILHVRWGAGRPEQYSAFAAELIGFGVDVIVGSGARCEAAFALTKSIPIVCPTITEPVEKGLIASFNRPGGNVTGILLLTQELFHKRFQLLKEAIPTTKRVGVLWAPENRILLDWTKTAALLLDFDVEPTRIVGEAEIEAAFEVAIRNRFHAVVTTQSPLFAIHRGTIARLGLKHRIPTMRARPVLRPRAAFWNSGRTSRPVGAEPPATSTGYSKARSPRTCQWSNPQPN